MSSISVRSYAIVASLMKVSGIVSALREIVYLNHGGQEQIIYFLQMKAKME